MEPRKDVLCPICQRPLADGPTTTTVDNTPYLLRHEPPVSIRVHRTCLVRRAEPALAQERR